MHITFYRLTSNIYTEYQTL